MVSLLVSVCAVSEEVWECFGTMLLRRGLTLNTERLRDVYVCCLLSFILAVHFGNVYKTLH